MITQTNLAFSNMTGLYADCSSFYNLVRSYILHCSQLSATDKELQENKKYLSSLEACVLETRKYLNMLEEVLGQTRKKVTDLEAEKLLRVEAFVDQDAKLRGFVVEAKETWNFLKGILHVERQQFLLWIRLKLS
ncbi:hypothetical protein CFOL_v3_26278 [Cephalotus follicularis]|uniref:Uncharacterized protein n=1 Tax=Cephalotus follicularis TaxID=3775 RepID=A0A1Q3CRH5_CEPFO|nr:hypothetical protein CFOL_v3_26278 [Cephalotus follicularis]